jgi:hypothetical protein
VRSKSGNVSFKLKEGHIVLKVGDEKLPKGIMCFFNKGITPKNPAALKDLTVVFVN